MSDQELHDRLVDEFEEAPEADPEPPRTIGELIERAGDRWYLCLDLTAIGGDR